MKRARALLGACAGGASVLRHTRRRAYLAAPACSQMNGPVHEVQHLPRQKDLGLSATAALPLEHPDLHEPPTSQALHLSATQGAGRAGGGCFHPWRHAHKHRPASRRAAAALLLCSCEGQLACGMTSALPCPADLLLGRADSGMCWLFDLSERLGWADGSHAGSWLRTARQGQATWRSDAMSQGPGGDADMPEGPTEGEATEVGGLTGLAGEPSSHAHCAQPCHTCCAQNAPWVNCAVLR